MEQLSKRLLRNRERLAGRVEVVVREGLPERIVQFGEGNFLRGFFDWMIHQLNKSGRFNGRVVAVQPTPHGKVVPKINAQDGLYTVVLRGIDNGRTVDHREIVASISRGINPYESWEEVLKLAENPEIQIVVSNTTEAGLTYAREAIFSDRAPLSYPGKLTAFLYRRYRAMGGAPEAGMIIIPCELVENNGERLKEIVLRIAGDHRLERGFREWLERHNEFCNTLVDRIVTGYPEETIDQFRRSLGYEDALLTVGEPYHLFAIDGGRRVADLLPFDQVGLNVHWGDVRPFRELKVRILNGAHTMMFAAAYLSGKNTVLEAMRDSLFYRYVRRGIYEEILPVLRMEEEQKRNFADKVVERFLNPYIRHALVDIGLNAVLKYRERLLPTLLAWVERKGRLPEVVTFSLASLIAYYRGERVEGTHLIGRRGEEEYAVRDDAATLRFFRDTWAGWDGTQGGLRRLAGTILGKASLWGRDLTTVGGLQERVAEHLQEIIQRGMSEAVQRLLLEEGDRR